MPSRRHTSCDGNHAAHIMPHAVAHSMQVRRRAQAPHLSPAAAPLTVMQVPPRWRRWRGDCCGVSTGAVPCLGTPLHEHCLARGGDGKSVPNRSGSHPGHGLVSRGCLTTYRLTPLYLPHFGLRRLAPSAMCSRTCPGRCTHIDEYERRLAFKSHPRSRTTSRSRLPALSPDRRFLGSNRCGG